MVNKFIESQDDMILIEHSGVQFTDFKIDLSALDEDHDELFVISSDAEYLEKIKKIEKKYVNLVKNEELNSETNIIRCELNEALEAYENKWFPIPFLKKLDDRNGFADGPSCWARAFLKKIAGEEKMYHLVIAFDTSVNNDVDKLKGLFPLSEDIRSGAKFALCSNFLNINSFIKDNFFVSTWINNIWEEYSVRKEYTESEKQKNTINHQGTAFYQTIISLLLNQDCVKIPRVKIIKYQKFEDGAVPVDLVLDVGNSRTCALFVERHPNEKGFSSNYQMGMRDLTDPTIIYNDAFPSRVEFAIPSFNNGKYCVSPNGATPFVWASMVRTGYEAQKLTWNLEGNEGLTGLSSPKRYLWDDEEQKSIWYVNPSCTNNESKSANIAPIQTYINQAGFATYENEDYEAVFEPKYSRMSLMTFLLNEILAQSYCLINSVYQRSSMKSKDSPRYLKSIILTIPPGMPREEIEAYEQCMKRALGIFWKAMKWDTTEDDVNIFKISPDDSIVKNMWPKIPEVQIKWDEAICGQVVFIYNEMVKNFSNNYDNFFRSYSRRRDSQKLVMATVDIGGGTSDIVINQFSLNSNGDAIAPTQFFRESFKVAGDDIMLNVIKRYVVSSIKAYMKGRGAYDDDISEILSRKIGGTSEGSAQEKNLKKILTLQLFEPLALKILSAYEKYGARDFDKYDVDNRTFRDILESSPVNQNVIDYISRDFAALIKDDSFSIMDVILRVNFKEFDNNFSTCQSLDICEKVFSYMAEVIHYYNCDVVLLTGRPSNLPGILSCFRNRVDIPPKRVISMHSYKIADWYPMRKNGFIDDPKTTAAVGALICHSSANGALTEFNFKSLSIKIKSCVRYLGRLDAACERLYDKNIYYRDVNFDDPKYKFDGSFRVSGPIVLGYRSMPYERWPASILYKLVLSEKLARQLNADADACIEVTLERNIDFSDENDDKNKQPSSKLSVRKSQSSNRNIDCFDEDVKIKLCTLPDRGLSDNAYWLDSGSILINE